MQSKGEQKMNNGSLDNNTYNHHKGLINAPQSILVEEVGKDTTSNLKEPERAITEARSEETK